MLCGWWTTTCDGMRSLASHMRKRCRTSYRFGDHIGRFEAAEFILSSIRAHITARELASPPFEVVYIRACTNPGHPRSASNMTTWINSQFPRPDFHRQVQRHYGLQDTTNPSNRTDTTNPSGSVVVRIAVPSGDQEPQRSGLQSDRTSGSRPLADAARLSSSDQASAPPGLPFSTVGAVRPCGSGRARGMVARERSDLGTKCAWSTGRPGRVMAVNRVQRALPTEVRIVTPEPRPG